jgi:hypothetical protein
MCQDLGSFRHPHELKQHPTSFGSNFVINFSIGPPCASINPTLDLIMLSKNQAPPFSSSYKKKPYKREKHRDMAEK